MFNHGHFGPNTVTYPFNNTIWTPLLAIWNSSHCAPQGHEYSGYSCYRNLTTYSTFVASFVISSCKLQYIEPAAPSRFQSTTSHQGMERLRVIENDCFSQVLYSPHGSMKSNLSRSGKLLHSHSHYTDHEMCECHDKTGFLSQLEKGAGWKVCGRQKVI